MDADLVRQRLIYDPASGLLTWTEFRPSGSGKFAKPGSVAGTLDDRGYVQVYVGGKIVYAHRIAWLLHYGTEPDGHIDHRDRNRANNRIDNLRIATNAQNSANKLKWRRKAEKNAHLPIGVKHEGSKFLARSGEVRIGRFDNAEDAGEAYRAYIEVRWREFAP